MVDREEPKQSYESLAVVVRFDRFDSDPRHNITLKEAFTSFDEADREVERLNELVQSKPHIEYFVKPVKYYPEGRGVKKNY